MKFTIIFLASMLLPFISFSQGSNCSTPIILNLDGVERDYTANANTAGNVICNDNGNTPVTWFSFTTDATGQCPLFSIEAPAGGALEVALYTSCANNANQSSSGMCFYDGEGLWAPTETFTIAANTTYYLRVKTANSGTIKIAAQAYSPSNNNCLGAHSIDDTPRTENNACNKPPTGLIPAQLCALSLENTAFYQYYVATAGISIINISNVTCDNIANDNSNGFQVGFFTGECGSLTPLNCAQVFGSFNQVTTRSLPAGTKVTVAIDGIGGSNCQFTISAFNAYGVLSSGFKNYSVWNKNSSNLIKWEIENDDALYYEVERSYSGGEFQIIGRILKNNTSQYSFEDFSPSSKNFYRVRKIKENGKILYSEIKEVRRTEITQIQLTLLNTNTQTLDLKMETVSPRLFIYTITNLTGQVLTKGKWNCKTGLNQMTKNISALSSGKYLVTLSDGKYKISKQFIKMN